MPKGRWAIYVHLSGTSEEYDSVILKIYKSKERAISECLKINLPEILKDVLCIRVTEYINKG